MATVDTIQLIGPRNEAADRALIQRSKRNTKMDKKWFCLGNAE